jgi:hypothetical protein
VSHVSIIRPLVPNVNALRLLHSPGRFLAANEIKALLAHILVTYDVKFEEGKGVPPERRLGSFRMPRNSNVLFRKRQQK